MYRLYRHFQAFVLPTARQNSLSKSSRCGRWGLEPTWPLSPPLGQNSAKKSYPAAARLPISPRPQGNETSMQLSQAEKVPISLFSHPIGSPHMARARASSRSGSMWRMVRAASFQSNSGNFSIEKPDVRDEVLLIVRREHIRDGRLIGRVRIKRRLSHRDPLPKRHYRFRKRREDGRLMSSQKHRFVALSRVMGPRHYHRFAAWQRATWSKRAAIAVAPDRANYPLRCAPKGALRLEPAREFFACRITACLLPPPK